MACVVTKFLFDRGGGEEGGAAASLLAAKLGGALLAGAAVAMTGSLAGIGKLKGPVEAARLKAVATEGAGRRPGSAAADWERQDGPAGSLAGMAGKTSGPAD